jgi:hypothetical protein
LAGFVSSPIVLCQDKIIAVEDPASDTKPALAMIAFLVRDRFFLGYERSDVKKAIVANFLRIRLIVL